MTEKLFKELFSFLKECARIEIMSTAGRINIIGMVLSLILAIILSLPAILETLVRLIRPQVNVGVSLLQIFIAFGIFTIICAGMLGYLERGSSPKGDSEHAGKREPSEEPHADPDAEHMKP